MNKLFSLVLSLLLIAAWPGSSLGAGPALEGDSFDPSQGVVASSQDKRKVVSVVYDDSTSMSMDASVNWAYANYAFQGFYALLNEGDVLYVTTTAAPYRTTRYDAINKQEQIDSIREYFDSGNTFIESTQAAMDALLTHEADSETLEYWLVVITDGEFYDHNYDRLSSAMLNDLIKSYSRQLMPNGSTASIAYVPIGDLPLRIQEDTVNKIYVRTAHDTNTIIWAITQVAQLMSRSTSMEQISFAEYSLEPANVLQISTRLPLNSICVMLNHSTARLMSAENEDGVVWSEGSLILQYPEYSGMATDHSLYSTVTFIGDGRAMAAGQYRLTFDQALNTEDVQIFIEPAIELRLALFDSHSHELLTSLDPLYTNTQLYAGYGLFDSLSGQRLQPERYFDSVNLSIRSESENKVLELAAGDDMELYSLTLVEAPMSVFALAQLDDLSRLTAQLHFTPQTYIDYSIAWEQKEAHTTPAALLGNTDQAYSLRVLANGEPLSGGDIKRLGLAIEPDTEIPDLGHKYEIDRDGLVTVSLHYLTEKKLPAVFLNWLPTYTVQPGDIRVNASLYSPYAEDWVNSSLIVAVQRDGFARLVFNLLQPLLLLLLLAGYIVKRRFARNTRLYAIALSKNAAEFHSGLKSWLRASPQGSGRQRLSWRALIPFVPQMYKLGGMGVFADGKLLGETTGIYIKNNGRIAKAWKYSNFTLDSHVPVHLHENELKPIPLAGSPLIHIKHGQAVVLMFNNGEYVLVGVRLRDSSREKIERIGRGINNKGVEVVRFNEYDENSVS